MIKLNNDSLLYYFVAITDPALLPEGEPLPDRQCGYLSDTQYMDLTSCRRREKAIGAICSKGDNKYNK